MSRDEQIEAEEQELQGLVDSEVGLCAVSGCTNREVDQRGPIAMRDRDQVLFQFWVCIPHWEAIITILGQQAFPSVMVEPIFTDDEVSWSSPTLGTTEVVDSPYPNEAGVALYEELHGLVYPDGYYQ